MAKNTDIFAALGAAVDGDASAPERIVVPGNAMDRVQQACGKFGVSHREYMAWVDLGEGERDDLDICDQDTIDALVADYAAHRAKYVAIARGITGKRVQ